MVGIAVWAAITALAFGVLHPIIATFVAIVVLTAVALALQGARDLGESVAPERRGRAAGRASLASTTALVARLDHPPTSQRNAPCV